MNSSIWIEVAISDLKSSIVLYDNKNFSQSLFYFFQAIEKSTKYLGISLGIIEANRLRKDISHETVKIFKVLIENINNNQEINSDIKLDDLNNLINSVRERSDKERAEFVLRYIKKSMNKDFPIPMENMDSPFILMINYLKSIGIKDPILEKPMSENEFKHLENVLKETSINKILIINYASKITMVMLVLNIFTNCYKIDDLRYPGDRIKNPNSHFDEENDYVKILPELFHIIEELMGIMKKLKWKEIRV